MVLFNTSCHMIISRTSFKQPFSNKFLRFLRGFARGLNVRPGIVVTFGFNSLFIKYGKVAIARCKEVAATICTIQLDKRQELTRSF